MRQRKIKNLDEKLAALSAHVVDSPDAWKGRWRSRLGTERICLEIGCGKGKFIDSLAGRYPETGFVAVEGNLSVAYHALEKVEASGHNVLFLLQYINDLADIFDAGELNGIYLNFSDPWPKVRHEKRRLTTRARMLSYAEVLAPGGVLEFKTDNDGLFEYTLTQIPDCYEECFVTRDLHGTVPEEEIVTTEYEDKFAGRGKAINFLRLRRR
ncbi:tRNA (guanosine(46)-N7)-methyltransferase TrmB [Eubacterium sp. AB3007]|uniref:tRNA (guanosine(46)-N7)-methyltransferase TrmB n=1 Tax=Eubacterium sp. AB3007 TaxID=1392487 RepID=UPI0004846906|nr:tRNA (guanosine(46)-N7)-methyltransferase TrmB [Eubacterium sp. AB3007]